MKKIIISVVFCMLSIVFSNALSFEIEGEYVHLIQTPGAKESKFVITNTTLHNEDAKITLPIMFAGEAADALYFKFSSLDGDNFIVFKRTKSGDVIAILIGDDVGDVNVLEKK